MMSNSEIPVFLSFSTSSMSSSHQKLLPQLFYSVTPSSSISSPKASSELPAPR